MQKEMFIRKPFVVEAKQITDFNISDLAPLIGELCVNPDGSKYIAVDPNLVPNVPKVFPGFWVTWFNGQIRCFSRRSFLKQFIPATDEIQEWLKTLEVESPDN